MGDRRQPGGLNGKPLGGRGSRETGGDLADLKEGS